MLSGEDPALAGITEAPVDNRAPATLIDVVDGYGTIGRRLGKAGITCLVQPTQCEAFYLGVTAAKRLFAPLWMRKRTLFCPFACSIL